MRRRGSRSVKVGLLGAVVCALCASASCSEDGVTSNCPDRPLYQTFPLGDSSLPDANSGDSATAQQALAAAIDAGCATGPSGSGPSGKGGSSSATAGAAGDAASGGTVGSAGEGGTSSADSAGAAGRN